MSLGITSLSVSEIDAEVKKWGNSLGIRVPAALAHAQGIAPGDTVRIRIEKLTKPSPGAFGAGRGFAGKYDARLGTRKREILREERARQGRLGG